MSRRLAILLAATFAVAALAPAADAAPCPGNANGLGVSRTVQIDTTGGPGFGFEHYKAHDFLEAGEVVLTFDDGPLPSHTRTILKALEEQCAKATFFPVGKLAVGYPEVLREVLSHGHTVGSHTFNHIDLAKAKEEDAKSEIERGFSAVKRAFARLYHPDQRRDSAFETAVRAEVFNEFWPEIERIERQG